MSHEANSGSSAKAVSRQGQEITPTEASRRGYLGCMLTVALAVGFLLVVGFGFGLRKTYWHRIHHVQAFEGPDRVVLFVEIERAMRWPGFLQDAPLNFAAGLLRIDVYADGRVERTNLETDMQDRPTFNSNLYVVVKLTDGFYLVEHYWTIPRPAYRLERDRVHGLSSSESFHPSGDDRLEASRIMDDFSKIDAVSARHGWRRLIPDSGGQISFRELDPVVAPALGVTLHFGQEKHDGEGTESIIATFADHDRQTVFSVNTRRWKSHRSPTDLSYLRAGYAASGLGR